MKYVCLIYHDETTIDDLSEREYDALVSESIAYDHELRNSGFHILSDALESVRIAATLRVRDGIVAITDGPFAETKEQLGGFIVIEASDLNVAIRVGSKMPLARIGVIEIRPISEFDRPGREFLN